MPSSRAQWWLRWTAEASASAAGGLMLAAAFAWPAWRHLAFVAPVPWILIATGTRRAVESLALVALGLATFFGTVGAWMLTQHGPGAYVVTWTWVLLHVLPAPLAWRYLARRLPPWTFILHVPAAWVACEWLRARNPIGRPGVYLVGYSQADDLALVQSADIFGPWGVSFLVLAVAAVLAQLLRTAHASSSVRVALSSHRRPALAVILAIAATWGYGVLRLATARLEEGPRIAVVQPLAAHVVGVGRGALAQHANLTLEHVRPGEVDLIAWPENALMDVLDGQPQYRDLVSLVTRHVQADLLLSAFRTHPSRPGRAFSSVFQMTPDGSVRAWHDKVLLVPGTEYVPLEESLRSIHPACGDAARKAVGFIMRRWPTGVAGTHMTAFELATPDGMFRFATPTCYEDTDSSLVRQAVRGGARFLVNPTSEGTIGVSASGHLLRIAVFRAIENRVSVVRAGNVGVSAFVDPLGRVQSVLADDQGRIVGNRGVLKDRVALFRGARPLSLIFGDWLPLACLAGLGVAVVRARRTAGA